MNIPPEGKLGKAAALSILALGAIASHFAILSPVLAFYDSNAQRLEQKRELVRRYENAAGALSELRGLANERQGRVRGQEALLTGSSDAVAAAALQSLLKDMVAAEGVRINSAGTLPPETQGDFRRVGIRIAFSGDLKSLTTVLKGIEGAHPVLAVGDLELNAAGGTEEDKIPNLAVTLDVFGYRAK